MSHVLLVTQSTTHLAATNSKAAMEAGGHTVTAVNESTLGSVSLAGIDVIATVRATPTTVSPWLSARWSEGYPLLLGGPQNGATGGSTGGTVADLGIANPVWTEDSTAATNSEFFNDTVGHEITAGFASGSDVTVLEGNNFVLSGKPSEAGYADAGVRIGLGGYLATDVYGLAVDVGTTLIGSGANKPASGKAPARAVFLGWFYAGQTGYTADGKKILDQAVDWLDPAPASPTYSAQVAADSPLASWPMGDASTTMADSSGNARNGTHSAGVTAIAGFVVGAPGNASTYGGGDSSTVADAAWMNTTVVTAEAWVRFPNTAGQHLIIGRDNNGNDLRWRLDSDANTFRWIVNVGGVYKTLTAGVMEAVTTYHVVGTYDGITLRLYVNGSQVGSLAASGSIVATAGREILMGRQSDGNGPLAGPLDEVAVYGTVLSATRVLAHYNAGTTAPSGSSIALGRASESDAARSISFVQTQAIPMGKASESDSARLIEVGGQPLSITLGRAAEADLARQILVNQPIVLPLGRATETDASRIVNPKEPGVVNRAVESDIARQIRPNEPKPLIKALETDAARAWIVSVPSPAHDDFAEALVIDYDYGGEALSLRNGSIEAGETAPVGSTSSVWLTWTSEEIVNINFAISGYPTTTEFTATVYANNWANPVVSASGVGALALVVPTVDLTTYWLQISAVDSALDVEVGWYAEGEISEPEDPVEYLRAAVYSPDGRNLITEVMRRQSPSLQEPLNEAGFGEMTMRLDDPLLDDDAYPDLLEFGNIVKFFLGVKCIHGFRIRNRRTAYVNTSEWSGLQRTVSGPSVQNILDDFIVRHDLPYVQDRSLDTRSFTWAAPAGAWFKASEWVSNYNTSVQTDPPIDAGDPPKKRPKWKNPPNFPDKQALWMWVSEDSAKNTGGFQPPEMKGMRYFRKEFSASGSKMVRLYASADEAYTIFLDGEEVLTGSGEETGYTQLDKRKMILSSGPHTLAVMQKVKGQVSTDGADAFLMSLMEINDGGRPTSTIVRSDASWLTTYERPVPAWNRAHVLRKVINEAQDRINYSANYLTFAFTNERDTRNRKWTDRWNEEVSIGATCLELQSLLSEGNGFDVWVDPEFLEVKAWRRRGRDRSRQISLEPGRNLLDWEVEETDEVRNTFLIQYDGGWTNWKAEGSRHRYGRREAYVQTGRARSDEHAQRILKRAVSGVGWAQKRSGASDLRRRSEGQPDGSLIAVPGARPFLDFGVGDIVMAPNENGVLKKHRVLMLSAMEDADGNLTYDPELEEL